MPGDNSFTVTAIDSNNSNGASGSVQGNLTVAGQPITQSNPNAYGVVAALTPSQASAGQGTSAQYVVQLTNTGNTDETFDLWVHGLPYGVSYSFSHNDVVVPPGASNFRDVTLTVEPGIAPGSYPFSVTATAEDNTSSATADGTLTVLANGVQVSLTPTSGAPGSTFQMTVINTGTVTDTYNLTLAGPAALVASLATTTVTLAPGTYQVVPITTGAVSFADPGNLALTAIATSQTNSAVVASDTADLTIFADPGHGGAVPAAHAGPPRPRHLRLPAPGQ